MPKFAMTILLGLLLAACRPAALVNLNGNLSGGIATTTVEIDTSNWKTYRNEEYAFEFRYPEQFSGKRFNIDDSIQPYTKDSKYTVGIWPSDSGFQDHMIIFVVVEKGTVKDPGFLPPGLRSNYHDYERTFDLSGRKVKGYESVIGSDNYGGESEFISQYILMRGKNHDYYINSGFFLSTQNCSNSINCFRLVDAIIETFTTM